MGRTPRMWPSRKKVPGTFLVLPVVYDKWMGSTRIVRVWVDERSCAFNGACYLPDSKVFLQTDAYYPTVASNASEYFESNRRQVIEAVLGCPTCSIFLEFEDGKVISSEDYHPSAGLDEWINY
jgi:ferredoxin